MAGGENFNVLAHSNLKLLEETNITALFGAKLEGSILVQDPTNN